MDAAHPLALGVAGNMTGHLEQAGEAGDFVGVRAAQGRPKGMFPIYVPGHPTLGTWPFSDRWLDLPADVVDVQPEPEVALRCHLAYDAEGVTTITPTAFAAADDTSLRRPADKIHHKKNWGSNAKGLATDWQPLDRFDAAGVLHRMRLACWLRRDGTWHPYGEDSAVRDYGTHYDTLTTWMVDRLRHQRDEGPLADVSAHLDAASRPTEAVICIGATRYTPFGSSTYVRPGDDVLMVLYDEAHPPDPADPMATRGASVLCRRVRAFGDPAD